MKHKEYLSEEELCGLIAQVEEQELVQAPGDLLTKVLQKAEKDRPKPAVPAGKRREFQRYCVRVVTSMAAAIVMVFLLPGTEGVRQEPEPPKQIVMQRQKEEISRKAQQEESLTEKIGSCRVIRDGQLWSIIKDLGGK